MHKDFIIPTPEQNRQHEEYLYDLRFIAENEFTLLSMIKGMNKTYYSSIQNLKESILETGNQLGLSPQEELLRRLQLPYYKIRYETLKEITW